MPAEGGMVLPAQNGVDVRVKLALLVADVAAAGKKLENLVVGLHEIFLAREPAEGYVSDKSGSGQDNGGIDAVFLANLADRTVQFLAFRQPNRDDLARDRIAHGLTPRENIDHNDSLP